MAPAAVPELGARIAWMIQQLEEYGEGELGDQVNIIVAGPDDRLEDVSEVLGFDLREEGPEHVEVHPGWYELTLIVNGEGFGYWIFVPRDSADAGLLKLCASQLPTG